MSDLQDWRRQRMTDAAHKMGGKVKLGRALGYADGAFVGQMIRGERPITEKTVAAIHRLSGFAGWFDVPAASGVSSITPVPIKGPIQGYSVRSLEADDHPGAEYVQVPEHRVTFAAGDGRIAQFDEIHESSPATYRREWFTKAGVKPSAARRFQVHGESMAPLLHHGDTVLVNLEEKDVINGKVYALRCGDELRIKRLYRKLDGSLILHSDNPAHIPQDEEVPAALVAEHIGIIGRVRDKSGSGGL